jgi:hypothetical protein
MATTQQRISAVTNYTLEYFHQWHDCASTPAFLVAAAQLLLAVGSGPARAYTCEQTIRRGRVTVVGKEGVVAEAAVLLRALAFPRPGELHTLRVTDSSVVEFIVVALKQQERDQGLSLVLASVSAIEWGSHTNSPEAAFALLERYAANITELNCPLQRCDAADNVLARCIRLESLTFARHYAPSAWLQLSQLHTLRGVGLGVVSMAAIAAALPRLHTLSVVAPPPGVPASALAGFFEDLLPRLQVFEYRGCWPQSPDLQDAALLGQPLPSAPLPLPHLKTLKLYGLATHPPPWARFMGARPLDFGSDAALMISRWLPPEDAGAAAGGPGPCPFACVRTLNVVARSRALITPTNAARLLRAAPHLEKLMVCVFASEVDVDSSWLSHPAFDGLVHLKLKHIRVSGWTPTTPLTSDSVTRLRQRHFPRLRVVAIDGCEHYLTPLESPFSA